MAEVFLSYSSKDEETAAQFAEALQGAGVTVVQDVNLSVGNQWRDDLTDAVESAKVVVVLLSQASADSTFVQKEAEQALSNKQVVIPVQLDSDAKKNFIWPLLADRAGIQLDEDHSIGDAAQVIAQIVQSNTPDVEKAPDLGRGPLSKFRGG